MDENGVILLLHASKNNALPLIVPCAPYTLVATAAQKIPPTSSFFFYLFYEIFVKNLKIILQKNVDELFRLWMQISLKKPELIKLVISTSFAGKKLKEEREKRVFKNANSSSRATAYL